MKISTAISALLLSLIVAFCRAEGTIWVPMDENGYITVDKKTIGPPQNIAAGPFKILIDPTARYSTAPEDMSAHHESIATDNYGIEFQMGDFRMGRFMLPCSSVPNLPDIIYKIAGNKLVFTSNNYMIQDDDQEAGMCTSIFTADILNKYPDGVTVWGIPHIKTFNIQVDNDNKRVGLNQPA